MATAVACRLLSGRTLMLPTGGATTVGDVLRAAALELEGAPLPEQLRALTPDAPRPFGPQHWSWPASVVFAAGHCELVVDADLELARAVRELLAAAAVRGDQGEARDGRAGGGDGDAALDRRWIELMCRRGVFLEVALTVVPKSSMQAAARAWIAASARRPLVHIADPLVARALVLQGGQALCFVVPELRTEELCMAALAEDPRALQSVPPAVLARLDRAAVEAALLRGGRAALSQVLRHVPAEWLAERTFAQRVVELDGRALRFLPASLRGDRALVELAELAERRDGRALARAAVPALRGSRR
jgi:hypothetical protein